MMKKLNQPTVFMLLLAIFTCFSPTINAQALAMNTQSKNDHYYQNAIQNAHFGMKNVTVSDAFKLLKAHFNVNFLYRESDVISNNLINMEVGDYTLNEALEKIAKQINIKYKKVGNVVSILADNNFRNESKKTAEIEEAIANKVHGTVTGTEDKQALIGVSVLVKGTNVGTVTDADGKYEIAANKGQTLVFSYVGYKSREIVVGDGDIYDVSLDSDTQAIGEITVVGSRSEKPRTDVERPVPVDVLNAKELRATGQTELGQQVQFTSPSFNSTKNGINGIANYADPASLKGLSPDQMLVLIEGKRQHQFAAVQNNVTVGKGTVVTDLNAVPSLALERVEILRDGAAAQYGSDAIAGIANLVLKKSVGVGAAQIQYGATSKGDGGGYTAGLNYGFALGKKGYLNVTGSYQDVSGTDRSDPYNPQPVSGGTYTGIYTNVKATDEAALKANVARSGWGDGTYGSFHVSRYGSNPMKSGQAFYNAGYQLTNEWSLYSFGGFSNKQVFAGAFLRTALPTSATSDPELYPDGYAPQLPGTSQDYSVFVGVRRKTSTGWNVDLSTGYGQNYLDQWAKGSANPSFGAASPKDFYAGRIQFGQSLTEANISKAIKVERLKSLNLAFGTQYRVDNFQLKPGDDIASPFGPGVGPLAATKGKTPGSQGRVGIDPADKTNVNRSNIGVYADVESDITDRFLVATALRYENYSDFGSNISGKLAGRYKITENFSIRGSINKGFRAPLLQQIANAATTSTVQSGLITSTKQLPSSDARLKQVGIDDPKPETSWNYNLGVTAKLGNNFLFTVDAYQIDIKDRIIITENLKVANVAALKPLFTGFNEITFFTNAIGTQTKGVDFVLSYKQPAGNKSRLSASVALTVNKTTINDVKATPTLLQAGTKTPVILIDTISRALIETSQPHTKVLGSVTYQYSNFSVNLRGTYFGEATAWEKLTKANPGTTNLHQSQTFAGKTLFDISASYQFNKLISLTAGVNNVFNTYPDKVYSNYLSYTNGQVPYSRNINQFGFNGSYYFTTLSLQF